MSAEIGRQSNDVTYEDEEENVFTRLLRVDNTQLVEDVVDTFRLILKERHLLPPSQDNRGTMQRFLQAKGYDLDKAAHMWEEMIKWRKENGVDTILQDFGDDEYEDLQSYYPQFFHGIDKKGRPVLIECPGKADCSKLKDVIDADRYLRFHIFGFEKTLTEKFPACSRAANKPINSMTRIIDLDGVAEKGCTKVVKDLFIRMNKIDREYYTETAYETFYINVSMRVRLMWAVRKFFYRACKTPLRTHCLGYQFQKKLLEIIDEDQLPAFLGGSCSCPGEGGCLRSDKGPWKDQGTMKAASVALVPNLDQSLSGLNGSKNTKVEEVNLLSNKLDEVFPKMIHNGVQVLPGPKLDDQVFPEMIHNVKQSLHGLKGITSTALEEKVDALSEKLDMIQATLNQLLVAKQQASNRV